jgi:hypothetical protein
MIVDRNFYGSVIGSRNDVAVIEYVIECFTPPGAGMIRVAPH